MCVLGIAVVCMVVLRPVVQHIYVCIGHHCCLYGGVKANESGSAPLCMYWALLLFVWWY